MSVRDWLHLFFLRWKWIVIPPVMAVLFSGVLLLFVQPKYVSVFKLWMKDRYEESGLLRIQRKGVQEDTHIQVQSEIIKSNRVLEDVAKRLDLSRPLPSQSLIARFTGWGQGEDGVEDKTAAERSAVKALHKNVTTEIVNPEIMLVIVYMNEPELARTVARTVVESYRDTYLELLLYELDANEEYLLTRQKQLAEDIEARTQDLIEFEQQYREAYHESGLQLQAESPQFAENTVDAGPVPLIMRQLADLEMQRNRLSVIATAENASLKRLDAEIRKNRELLDRYLQKMSTQATLAIQHKDLLWRLQEARTSYKILIEEMDKLTLSRGVKMKEGRSITVLDAPSLDTEQVFPRKKATLIAAAIVGGMAGLALAYLIQVADPTYHVASQLAEELKVPVAAWRHNEEEDSCS